MGLFGTQRQARMIVFLAVFIISQSPSSASTTPPPKEELHREYPPYDGWFNNYAHPDWGGAETQLLRRVPPAYSDGTYEPSGETRPNPMTISMNVFNGSTGNPSYMNRTAFMVFFGQQVVEEILDAQRPGCPPEYKSIEVPEGHEHYDSDKPGAELPFLRSRYDQRTGFSPNNPRQQLNEISAFLDGGLVYGPNKAWLDALRAFEDGLLAEEPSEEKVFPRLNDLRLPMANPPPPRQHKLLPIKRFFMLGNPRGNENPFLLTFGIMWFRYHNYRARQLKKDHSDWDDERLFNEARRWVIAVHQKVVVYDWLPAWLNQDLEDYKGYDPTVHPGIAHIFQSAAMRYGHTLVPPGVYRRKVSTTCEWVNTTKQTFFDGHRAIRTCNSFWNPQESIRESDIDEYILGMASQVTEREDNIITPDLRGNVFGPLEFSRRDLMAINIQRGRDHGLPDFNTARIHYGLDPVKNWDDLIKNRDILTDDPELLDRLKNLYDSIDDLDIWVGGLLETTNQGPGDLFTRVIADQFQRIRDGDRFWYENYKRNGLYTKEEVAEIGDTTIFDVILATTNITSEMIQSNPFFYTDTKCEQPVQLSHTADHMSECTAKKDFDYFSGSEVSYALSFFFCLATFFVFLAILICLAKRHQAEVEKSKAMTRKASRTKAKVAKEAFYTASEWMGTKDGSRNVRVKFDVTKKVINVLSVSNRRLRTVDMSRAANSTASVDVFLSADRDMKMVLVRMPKEYDMTLSFDHVSERQVFMDALREFLGNLGVKLASPRAMSEKQIQLEARTVANRKKQLENFFRAVFAHAFSEEEEWDTLKFDKAETKDVVTFELTKYEFAEALGMTPESLFVDNMFSMMDEDNSGYISFREFLDMIIVFHRGNADQKAELLFKMYDLDRTNTLSREEFKTMLRSLVELANTTIEEDKIQDVVDGMFSSAGLADKSALSLSDFQSLLGRYSEQLEVAHLQFDFTGINVPEAKKMKRENAPTRARKTFFKQYSIKEDERDGATHQKRLSSIAKVQPIERKIPQTKLGQKWMEVVRFVENYKLHIFWLMLYTLVSFGIFIERAYYYSVEREHAGLRRIAGYGVTVTRGAASGMMFTFACLLVTMCRNTITFLRETFLHRYIPFDGAIAMHKYIAGLALFFTLMHIIGHAINFYHVSTQTANDLTCLFRNFFHATDELPKFHYWCWETLTGFTGVLLTINLFLIYIFGVQYARRHAYKAFWWTHNTYPIFFILMILHGAGRLVQPGFFHYFLLGPAILFTLDRLVSVSRKLVEIPIVKAELLPSDVTYLEIKRPNGFDYKSGQWVRIACTVQGENEYHPFTLSSAPHEENLTLHIRAVGPWTYNLRRTYDPALIGEHHWPKVFLDGPYGEGHQDWYRYDVAVLVGGGIGVTPFTSILKDIAHMSKTGARINCKKVYFLWVTRTQKQFEWVTDIIRQVEDSDIKNLVSVHIFITQFKQKFDIRTTMLYICERYFQKISNRSLFTGLRSITHFGRPDFAAFFQGLEIEHTDTSLFGVFSCGPPPMTRSVEKACSAANKSSQNVLFVHHFENF